MLKTTLIGHASLLIQSRETTILTDPVWFDYLWEEINVLCPRIELDKDKVPPLDVLYLSHRHQDHFDVRTLAYLVKNQRLLTPDTIVMAPKDDILLDVLNELEFKNVRVIADFESVTVKDITFTPTPSLNQSSTSEDYYPEHGIIVSDGEVTVWNQVDTIVNPEIIEHIRQNFGQLDLVHSRFVPLLEGNFSYNKPCNLPFDEYCSFLNIIKTLSPKYVVPGSAAFRYRDEINFLNQYSFPTTQKQFLRDLAAFCPEVAAGEFLNGDVAHISPEGVRIESDGSDFMKRSVDDSHLAAFKPVMEVPPIRTRTTDPAQYEQEMNVVRDFVENQFMDRLLKSELLEGWMHWQVAYQLEVFGQEGSEIWSIDFAQGKPEIQKEDLGKINLYEGIASSEFYNLIEGRTSWDYVTLCGNYRTFNNLYRITEGNFEYFPSDKMNVAFEPLMDVFPWDQAMDREKFMKDVRRWKEKA
jgi:Beta-lactamase superfamily domain